MDGCSEGILVRLVLSHYTRQRVRFGGAFSGGRRRQAPGNGVCSLGLKFYRRWAGLPFCFWSCCGCSCNDDTENASLPTPDTVSLGLAG